MLPDWATRVTLGNRGQYEMAVMGSSSEYNDPDGLSPFLAGNLAVITATSFGHSIEGTKRNILRNMENPHVQYYLGKRGEEAVGCLNLDEGEKEFGIYAFAVLLPYRRRGFGRQMLELVIKQVRAASEKGIALEVETMNETAIGLYRSCGFRETTTYGYYTIDLLK